MIDARRAWQIHGGPGFDVLHEAGDDSLASRWGRVFADRASSLALTGDTGTVTYAELDDLTRRVAGGFRRLGVNPGDRVAVIGRTSLPFIATYVGLLRTGGVLVPVNPAYRERELERIVSNADPAWAAVDSAEGAALVAAVAPGLRLLDLGDALPDAPACYGDLAGAVPAGDVDQIGPGHPAVLAYTSGTTGASKGAVLSHRNLLAGVLSVIRAWGWTANDRLLLALPLFHLHGLGVGLNGTFTIGSTAHVHSAFEAERAFEDIEAERPTMIFGVPAMYHRLVDHESGADLSSLRLAVSGSAPLPEAMFRRISERLGVEPLERYGMTETLMNISNPLRGERRPGTVGLPLPGVEVRLVVDGEDVSPGDEGEIWLRGPNIFSGYRNDPAATEASFTDGWFMSGDLARADGDGYIRITGRAKDLIITGGYNVHPREVEDVLADHPGIRDAAVVGTPSDEWGEQVTAFVVPTADALDVEELVAWCDQRLARYKIPKEFHLVDELPRNALGKLQRHLLRPS